MSENINTVSNIVIIIQLIRTTPVTNGYHKDVNQIIYIYIYIYIYIGESGAGSLISNIYIKNYILKSNKYTDTVLLLVKCYRITAYLM